VVIEPFSRMIAPTTQLTARQIWTAFPGPVA
jgi:hypothetical protein